MISLQTGEKVFIKEVLIATIDSGLSICPYQVHGIPLNDNDKWYLLNTTDKKTILPVYRGQIVREWELQYYLQSKISNINKIAKSEKIELELNND